MPNAAYTSADGFDPNQFEIAGHDFTETPLQREMRLYQEKNGNATSLPNAGIQMVKAPDGNIYRKQTDSSGNLSFTSGYNNGSATQYFVDPADGKWKQREIKEESGGIIKGAVDTVLDDKKFMAFLAVSGAAMGAAAATGSTTMAGAGAEGAAGAGGSAAAAAPTTAASAAPVTAATPTTTAAGAGGMGGGSGLTMPAAGGGTLGAGGVTGGTAATTAATTATATSTSTLGSSIFGANSFWGSLLDSKLVQAVIPGVVSGIGNAMSEDAKADRADEAADKAYQRQLERDDIERKWKVRNMTADRIPKFNWTIYRN